MAAVVTITIGTDDFSVYALDTVALTDANTFWNGRLGSQATAWAAATDANKSKALVMAADWIDRAITFDGAVTVDGQPRAWPRDGATKNGVSITDGTTPDDLANAEFWLAGEILADNDAATTAGQGSNVKEVRAGTAGVTFFRPTINTSANTRLPSVANDYLRGYYASSSLLPSGSGDEDESEFDEDDFVPNGL